MRDDDTITMTSIRRKKKELGFRRYARVQRNVRIRCQERQRSGVRVCV
jgi:hypothetical protein